MKLGDILYVKVKTRGFCYGEKAESMVGPVVCVTYGFAMKCLIEGLTDDLVTVTVLGISLYDENGSDYKSPTSGTRPYLMILNRKRLWRFRDDDYEWNLNTDEVIDGP